MAKNKVLYQTPSKAALIELASKHGVKVVKSWSRDRIIDTFEKYPHVCQKLIGLEVEGEVKS